MGVARYNRGSRVVARDHDAVMPRLNTAADLHAYGDESRRLRSQVADLQRELARARRCLAAERLGRENARLRHMDSASTHRLAVSILCRLAFPDDHQVKEGETP